MYEQGPARLLGRSHPLWCFGDQGTGLYPDPHLVVLLLGVLYQEFLLLHHYLMELLVHYPDNHSFQIILLVFSLDHLLLHPCVRVGPLPVVLEEVYLLRWENSPD